MFQFSTQTVINSNLDSNGTTAKYAGTSTDFTVTRVNKFLKNNILSVYKRAYIAPVKEVATFVVPQATSGKVIRLSIDVRLTTASTDSEYASTYLYFKKPVVVEVYSVGAAITDATALVKQINGLKDRFGYSYITASNVSGTSATITLTATNEFQRFKSIALDQESASTNSMFQPNYDSLSTSFTVTTSGKEGFGDDTYMIKAVRVPTFENQRYFAPNTEERPIPGGNYTQYTIRYSVAKSDDGIIAGRTSVTTHVFYVLETLKTEFEAQLSTTFPGIVTVGGAGALTISGDEVLDLSNAETTTLIASGTNTAITWSSSNTAIATVSVSGLVTPVATGTAIITATAADGKTGTFTIKVVA